MANLKSIPQIEHTSKQVFLHLAIQKAINATFFAFT